MAKRTDQNHPLLDAAEAVDREITHFQRLAAEAIETKLDSQKKLAKAGRILTEICDAEERLRARVAELVNAVAQSGNLQQELATQVQQWALEVQARVGLFQELQIALGALGDAVGPVQQALTAENVDFDNVVGTIGVIVEQAAQLEAQATEAEFLDIAREAKARKEQLQAAITKLGRVRGAVPEA